jgi:hypothetical protein
MRYKDLTAVLLAFHAFWDVSLSVLEDLVAAFCTITVLTSPSGYSR